jgi:3'(2'), 5'-bisphosphate nucleotidase
MNETAPKTRIIGRDEAAALIDPLTDLVVKAGQAILGVNRRAMTIHGKDDGSPVTEADLAADRVIADGLAQIAPGVPSLSEERVQAAKPPFRGSFFLVDPLDGTKEFVAGRTEYTVNVALVTEGTPVLGIVGAPAFGWLWRGLVGRGAERLRLSETGLGAPEPIHTRRSRGRGEPWIAAVSRSHGDARTEAFIDARPGAVRVTLGSAVKFGRLAEGGRDRCRRQGHGRRRAAVTIRRTDRWLHHSGVHCVGRSKRELTTRSPHECSDMRVTPGVAFAHPGYILATAKAPARALANARLPAADTARDRRQRRRGWSPGRTDRAARLI